MKRSLYRAFALITAVTLATVSTHAQAGATQQKPFEPQVGQAGKDVVWVPTSQALVDKMLDTDVTIGLTMTGALTPADFPALLPGDPTRTTLMLDWSPSEFSRWRFQYAWDDARDDGDTVFGGDGHDAVAGDNAAVVRKASGGGTWLRHAAPWTDLLQRDVRVPDSAEAAGAYGPDTIDGGDGHDELHGELGADTINARAGEDTVVGDLGEITRTVVAGPARTISADAGYRAAATRGVVPNFEGLLTVLAAPAFNKAFTDSTFATA